MYVRLPSTIALRLLILNISCDQIVLAFVGKLLEKILKKYAHNNIQCTLHTYNIIIIFWCEKKNIFVIILYIWQTSYGNQILSNIKIDISTNILEIYKHNTFRIEFRFLWDKRFGKC